MYVDIDARISELGRQPYSARRFLLKYQDRVLFGTDTTPSREAYRMYFRFLETDDEYFDPAGGHHRQGFWMIYGVFLPDDVLAKLYNGNARKILFGLPPDATGRDRRRIVTSSIEGTAHAPRSAFRRAACAYERDGFLAGRMRCSTPRRSASCSARPRRTGPSTSTPSAGRRRRGKGPAVALEPPRRGIYGMFARCRRMVDSCEQILGGEVYHYHSKMIMKDAKVGGAWTWHQDYGYWYQNGVLFPTRSACSSPSIPPPGRTAACRSSGARTGWAGSTTF